MDGRRYSILDRVNSPADLKALHESGAQAAGRRDPRADHRHGLAHRRAPGVEPGRGRAVHRAAHASSIRPSDKIVWDVSHQCYAHKLLTGRKDEFPTLRQGGGISGFTRRDESEHDPFGAGHASTSISAALGLAKARDLRGGDEHVVAVIGDGAMTGGLALEGLNNAEHAPAPT